MNNFLKETRYFLRNPLGIIGLFITIVYLIAAILLNNGLDKLHGNLERLPLIGFVVLFPIIILFVFYRLVTKHYDKIYGPTDFKTDSAFLKYKNISFATREDVKINDEKKLKEEDSISLMSFSSQHDNSKEVKIQRINTLESKILDQLNKIYNVQFFKNIKISGTINKLIPDGYGLTNEKQFIVEIKFYKVYEVNIIKKTVDSFIKSSKSILNENLPTKYIFAFIFDDYKNKTKETINFNFTQNQDIDLIFFDTDCNVIS